jgi:hypothetical protein
MSPVEPDTADMLAAGMIAGMFVVAGIVIVAASVPVDATPSLDILEEGAWEKRQEGSLDEVGVRQSGIVDERGVRIH